MAVIGREEVSSEGLAVVKAQALGVTEILCKFKWGPYSCEGSMDVEKV